MPTRKFDKHRPAEQSGFPVPLDRKELRTHILVAFFHQLRTLAWMTDAASAWRVLGKSPSRPTDIVDPEYTAAQLGAYADIQTTPFAQSIERMYEYAYLGIEDASGEEMRDESIYTWIAAILYDLRGSRISQEWLAYTYEGAESARVCCLVAETANARRILEGEEEFFHFNEHGSADEALTVREVALVAGMEEMSIRAAISRKRANQLRSYSDGGRTLIKVADANAWLQGCGRYVPITHRWGSDPLDLAKQRFAEPSTLCSALVDHYHSLSLNGPDGAEINAALSAMGISPRGNPFTPGVALIDIEPPHLADANIVERLACALHLDAALLKLRAREALASEELTAVQRELRDLTKR